MAVPLLMPDTVVFQPVRLAMEDTILVAERFEHRVSSHLGQTLVGQVRATSSGEVTPALWLEASAGCGGQVAGDQLWRLLRR